MKAFRIAGVSTFSPEAGQHGPLLLRKSIAFGSMIPLPPYLRNALRVSSEKVLP
jgi:hypothetical protein